LSYCSSINKSVVDCIITNRAVIDVHENGLELIEVADGWTVDKVIASTEVELKVSSNIETSAY